VSVPKSATCKDCGKTVAPLDVFPGPLCMDCYAAAFDAKPLPSAQEIAAMWGGGYVN